MDSDSSDDYLKKRKRTKISREDCPYLKTVNRFVLDFDFEKVCCETLTNVNVYACLVCGKCLHGRSSGTPAYSHSMEHDHHVFMNLADQKAFCLPDNYEIIDKSLDDIKRNLDPTFTEHDLESIPTSSLSLTGTPFVPGIVGLNPIRDDSYLNSAIHALVPLAPIRDIFLTLARNSTPTLSDSFSELVRKMYNAESFKGIVSPHAFLQAVGRESSKEFFTSYNDPIKFIDWFLPTLDSQLTISKIDYSLKSSFQNSFGLENLWSLALDLPPISVFKDDTETAIPTVPLVDILTKKLETYSTIKLSSDYLILKINRFVKNDFFTEKDNTIVRYPLRGLDISDAINDGGIHQFDLVGVISHEGSKPDSGAFKTYTMARDGTWYECNGLRISKILPQSVAVVESYITIWKRSHSS